MELWDAYNRDETLAGIDLVRGEKIPEGLRHAAVGVFVMHQDGEILLMTRDQNTSVHPGMYECGAGGSVLKGESFEEGAKRELLEETGIGAEHLTEIYRFVTEDTIYKGYLYVTDCRKDAIVLQAGETAAYRWITKEECKQIYQSERFHPTQKIWLKEFMQNDFQLTYDCGFSNESNWFRYRAAAIIIEDGAVLLATNSNSGYYYSVGGGVHMGETAEHAVEREVLEETGVPYAVDRLAFIHENFFDGDGITEGKSCHEIAFYFLMKPRGTRELHSDSYCPEGQESMEWIPIEQLGTYKAFPTFFRDKLPHMSTSVEHIVTDERSRN